MRNKIKIYFKNLLRNENGFSLMEMLIAVSIVGIAFSVFMTALSISSLSVGTLNEATVAQNLAQRQIEQTRAATYDATGASYTLVTAPAGYTIGLAVNSALYADNKIQKLTVTITHSAQQVLVVEDYKGNR
jgi:prepilin-type N-terminal cleavage/methylation domain-containing protein